MRIRKGSLMLAGLLVASVSLWATGQKDVGTQPAGAAQATATAGAIAKFSEAPMLAEQVKAGRLPPVEQRLPLKEDVLVVQPSQRIGQYGGTMRAYMLNSSDTAALATLIAHKGLLALPRDLDKLMKEAPTGGFDYFAARSYEWNTDYTQVTMKLRRGMKWSDGKPLTSEDIRFAWYDVWFDKNINPTPPAFFFSPDGKPIQLAVPDETTLVFSMATPYPTWLWSFNVLIERLFVAKHWATQWHPKYNPKSTYTDYKQNTESTAGYISKPRIDAWVPKEGTNDTGWLFERNPYFIGVDPAGNQLPYIDSVRMRTVGNQENAVLAAIAGELDIAQRNFQQLDSLPVLIENEKRGNYKILFWRGSEFTNGTTMRINLNLLDPNYKELRELLRDKRFRVALSIAIDRKDMIETLFAGQGTPPTWGMNSTSPYWNEDVKKAVQKYAVYDPAGSKRILQELGLKYDGKGMLQYADGKPVTLLIDTNAEWTFSTKVGESLANYWRAVGIDARINPLDRGTGNQRRNQGLNHVDLWGPVSGELPLYRIDQEPFYASNLDSRYYGPKRVPSWLKIPEATLPEGGKEFWELHSKIRATGNKDHIPMMREMAKLQGEWLFTITIAVDLPLMVYRNNRMGNIPDVGISIHDVMFEKPEQFYIKQ